MPACVGVRITFTFSSNPLTVKVASSFFSLVGSACRSLSALLSPATDVVIRDKHATDDGQYDEEDASAGIASGCGWCPLCGEEWCAVVVCEGHGH
jgi:hypothetical protein